MVNTFLIGISDTALECYKYTAENLDSERCFNQVVEALRIINTINKKKKDIKTGYSQHTIVLMWLPYIDSLKIYYNTVLSRILSLGTHKTKMECLEIDAEQYRKDGDPWFVCYKPLIYSHRARLYQKNPEFYKHRFSFPCEYLSIGYIWTCRKPKEFYLENEDYPEKLADDLEKRYRPEYIRYCSGFYKSGKKKGMLCNRLLQFSTKKSISTIFCKRHTPIPPIPNIILK